MKELDPDSVVADYYCNICEQKVEKVPVQESIYAGPPLCEKCDEEMNLDKIYLIS